MASTLKLMCCSHVQSSGSFVNDMKLCCVNRGAVRSSSIRRLFETARYSGKILQRDLVRTPSDVSVRCCGAQTLCSGGSSFGSGGAGRGGISGGGGNDKKPTDYSGESNDGNGKGLWHNPGPKLLGAIALFAFSVAFPAPSHATPGSLFNSASNAFHMASSSTSGKGSFLSSSVPANGSGGLTDLLERTSMESSDLGRGGSSSTCNSPNRCRSKVMHVSCKGSTLVVPLTGRNSKEVDIPFPRTLLPWQRRKIVEAPIELSEREARMLASRQNRVRDSLLVQ